MRKNFVIAMALSIAGSWISLAQAQNADLPGESPGSIVLGPNGYFQKGPEAPGRGGAGAAGRGAAGRGAGRGAAAPTLSVRVDTRKVRTAATGLLGWKFGAPAGAFEKLTFAEAAAKVDAAGLPTLQGSSSQRVSQEIQKPLDFNLTPDEVTKVKSRLGELRLQMPAYRVETLPADEASRRKMFEFAKGLGVETIVAASESASLEQLDQLANESGVNVAFSLNPRNVEKALQGRSKRIGVVADLGKWMEAGIKPADGLALVKDRLMVVNVRDRSGLGAKAKNVTLGSGAAEVALFLRKVSQLDAVPAPAWPPRCGNCTGPRVPPGRPLYVTVDPTGEADPAAALSRDTEALETAIRPAMGWRVGEISRQTPISAPSMVHPEERKKIDAAIPRQALVKPAKPRKLLVIDVTPNAYYHATTANGNLAIELMAKYTGAFEPVFSNDLDNLKYPKIKQFDAVFLNGIGGGEVFVDPDVLDNGLIRFVREGGGVGGVHGSTFASLNMKAYGELMGAQEGAHRCCETSTIKIDDPNSLLTKAFGGKGFTWRDEFYHFPDTGPYSRDKVHVLLSMDAAKSDLSEYPNARADNEFGLTWIKNYGKGRVFNCALGHTPTLFMTPAFTEHILAAIQFILGDLKADTTLGAKLTAKK